LRRVSLADRRSTPEQEGGSVPLPAALRRHPDCLTPPPPCPRNFIPVSNSVSFCDRTVDRRRARRIYVGISNYYSLFIVRHSVPPLTTSHCFTRGVKRPWGRPSSPGGQGCRQQVRPRRSESTRPRRTSAGRWA